LRFLDHTQVDTHTHTHTHKHIRTNTHTPGKFPLKESVSRTDLHTAQPTDTRDEDP